MIEPTDTKFPGGKYSFLLNLDPSPWFLLQDLNSGFSMANERDAPDCAKIHSCFEIRHWTYKHICTEKNIKPVARISLYFLSIDRTHLLTSTYRLGLTLIFAMIVILAHLFFASVAALCYYPNGNLSPQDVPCSDAELESNCCGPGYACLSNKICRQAHQDLIEAYLPCTYGRGNCTDRSWPSSASPVYCILGSSRKCLFQTFRHCSFGAVGRC